MSVCPDHGLICDGCSKSIAGKPFAEISITAQVEGRAPAVFHAHACSRKCRDAINAAVESEARFMGLVGGKAGSA